MRREKLEAFQSLERELQQEKAAALGRLGRTLEQLLAALHDVRQRIASAPAEDRPRFIEEYRALHERALAYRWYLEVQREAVGLRRHDNLDETFPIPPPIVS